MAWTKASTPVAGVIGAGRLAVISGSSNASFGKSSGPQDQTLVPSASEKTETAHRINAMDDAGYLSALRPRFGDFLGEIRLEGQRFTYPLNLTIANSFVANRVALVGDAAHGMHPIAGQGLNAGLRDVGALAETLILANRRGEDFASQLVLERYQQWRRFDTATARGQHQY